MELCKTQDCTGCFACMNACSKNAISSMMDELGKTIPYIDYDKCVSCGLCRKVCPSINIAESHRATSSYAVWSRNEKDVRLSSSGGAAAVFAKFIIESGGVVYGCASSGDTAVHIAVDTIDGIDKLRGSKYVQSKIGLIYRDVRIKLLSGKKILFTGTPCQIAGLKGYLQKDFDNLITMDIICHGTPPLAYLQEHLQKKTQCNKIKSFSFRGEYDWFLTVKDNNDKVVYKSKRELDEYFLSFLDSLTYRDNCYSCSYAKPERVSDITVGDFWGLDRTTLKRQYNGRISVLLLNTKKGSDFFDKCKENFIFEERTFEEAANPKQWNLLHPSVEHPKRPMFIKNYPQYGFDKAVRKSGLGNKLLKNHILIIKASLKRKLNGLLKGSLNNNRRGV